MDLRLDHIGIQVKDFTTSIDLFANLFGYTQATEPVVNTLHRVEVVFLEKPGSLPIKLFRALDDGPSQRPRLHHLAFRVDDVSGATRELSARGARVLNPPAPGEAFEGEPIAFLFAGGLNIELLATDRRRGRIERGPDGQAKPARVPE
jgi:catechol 2,3-dioxygenase-like lactoylglutathione lyase family enzyme